jgi:hypothetical protein
VRATAARAEGRVGGGQAIQVGLARLRVKSPLAGIAVFFCHLLLIYNKRSPGRLRCWRCEEKTMLIRIITLRFSAALDGFDDNPLTEFIKDKSVVSLKEHFFIRNETPYLAVVVIYEPVLEMAC